MPYRANRELPKGVKDAIATDSGKTMFRRVVNSQLGAGKSETVAFASAWAALKRAGYEKGEDGKWSKAEKAEPTASSVHVPTTDWERDRKAQATVKFSDEDLAELQKLSADLIACEMAAHDVSKAEYQGKEVDLNKPFRLPSGSNKKFGVYVQDGDSVKRVTFGDPNMEIRRDDPEARENFRARHNCDEKTDKTSAGYWSCRMWEKGASVSELTKRQLGDDTFTTELEAKARSVDLGLGGRIHVHETADGQAVYMPGGSHDEYLERFEEVADTEEEEEEDSPSICISITVKSDGEVLKADTEQRIVYGWASVIEIDGAPVVDHQGDIIEEEELVKAVHDFVTDSRIGKVMHEGSQTSKIVDSVVFTSDLQKALGVDLGKVGWFVGMKIDDDEIWNLTKSGRLTMFSIGGKAMRETLD